MAGRPWHRANRRLAQTRWPLAGLAALAVILACVLVIPPWLVRWELGAQARTLSPADKAKAINDDRATLLQGIGGAVILLGAYFTYRQLQTGREQLQIAQQGQVTERFTRAIDQLGHPELDVRLGGIYALERIANDSPNDRTTIAEVLTAFVRGHAPWPSRLPGQYRADAPIEQVPELPARAPDVQAALTVLARRQPLPKLRGRLDLEVAICARRGLRTPISRMRAWPRPTSRRRSSTLPTSKEPSSTTSTSKGRSLQTPSSSRRASTVPSSRARTLSAPSSRTQFSMVPTFTGRTLSAPSSRGHSLCAQLQQARLVGAQLQEADLERAQLQKAVLVGAQLRRAHLERAQLRGAQLDVADLQGANLERAQLQGAKLEQRPRLPSASRASTSPNQQAEIILFG